MPKLLFRRLVFTLFVATFGTQVLGENTNGTTDGLEVEYLTPDPFMKKVFSGNFTFVLFCEPRNDKCEQLTPVWVELAKLFIDTTVRIFAVQCEGHLKDLCEGYKAYKYPSLKWFKSEDDLDMGDFYFGETTLSKLKNFVAYKAKDTCQAQTGESCSKREMRFVKEMSKWDYHTKQAEMNRLDGILTAKRDVYTAERKNVEKLYTEYQQTFQQYKDMFDDYVNLKRRVDYKVRILDQTEPIKALLEEAQTEQAEQVQHDANAAEKPEL